MRGSLTYDRSKKYHTILYDFVAETYQATAAKSRYTRPDAGGGGEQMCGQPVQFKR